MGIVMKKLVLLATALAMVSGSALAADLPLRAVKAPPPPAFEPWDLAFGSALMNDYIFRGITQSNHKPSVAAYFEPRYNVTKDVQLYIGAAGESISFPNRAAAEIDIYGGIRPTFGMFAFDFGVWGYLYPGGQCFGGVGPGTTNSCAAFGQGTDFGFGAGLPINGNFAKKNASFYEGYAKVNITINDQWAVGFNEYYSPNFVNLGAWGDYASVTAKWTAPSTTFGTSGVGMYASGAFGRQWLGPPVPFSGAGAPWLTTRRAFLSPATTPGTSASASPTRCSRWICATPTPISPRLRATSSPAITPRETSALPLSPRPIRAGSAPTGAARRASPSYRLT